MSREKTPCEICGEPTVADVTFDWGPIGTELCLNLCRYCQGRIMSYIREQTARKPLKATRGYRTIGPIEIYHHGFALKVLLPGKVSVIDKCIICKKKLDEPNNLLLLHKAEGIQVYSICDKPSCWEKLGKKMTEGKR